jgi:hypothetical protein
VTLEDSSEVLATLDEIEQEYIAAYGNEQLRESNLESHNDDNIGAK